MMRNKTLTLMLGFITLLPAKAYTSRVDLAEELHGHEDKASKSKPAAAAKGQFLSKSSASSSKSEEKPLESLEEKSQKKTEPSNPGGSHAASSSGVVSSDAHAALPLTELQPFTTQMMSKTQGVVEPLSTLEISEAHHKDFENLNLLTFGENQDRGCSLLTRYIMALKYGYIFHKGQYWSLDEKMHTRANRMTSLNGLKNIINRYKSRETPEPFTQTHHVMEKNLSPTTTRLSITNFSLLKEAGEDKQKKLLSSSYLLLNPAGQVPPIDFKETLVKTLCAATGKLQPPSADPADHRGEFVEPLSGRLFSFHLKTSFVGDTALGSVKVLPYTLTEDELVWDVRLKGSQDKSFQFEAFIEEDLTVAEIDINVIVD